MHEEKRKNSRYNAAIAPINCTRSDTSINDNKINITICDISSGGLGIESDKRLSVGDKIKLKIVMPDDGIPMFVAGNVTWVSKKSNSEVYSAGLYIMDISDVDRRRVAQYICTKFIILDDR